MQNKPNLPDAQMSVSSFYTVDYENKSNWTLGENKANQSQYKPNFKRTSDCQIWVAEEGKIKKNFNF